MALDNRAHDGEAETAPGSSARRGPGLIRLVEAIEDVRRCSGGMPGPVSRIVIRLGGYAARPAARRGRRPACAGARSTRRSQRLLEALHVGVELEVVGHVLFERDITGTQGGLVTLGDAIEQVGDRDRLDRERAAAALELRQIEQVTDDRLEPVSRSTMSK